MAKNWQNFPIGNHKGRLPNKGWEVVKRFGVCGWGGRVASIWQAYPQDC